jgi:hypothetical protein
MKMGNVGRRALRSNSQEQDMDAVAKPGFEVSTESNAERLSSRLAPWDSDDEAMGLAMELGVPCDDATIAEARRLLKVSADGVEKQPGFTGWGENR